MSCPSCHRPLEPGTEECPFCGVVLARFHGHALDGRTPGHAGLPGSPPASAPHALEPYRGPGPSGRGGVLLVALLLAGLAAWHFWPHQRPYPRVELPPARANLVQRDPCAGKSWCVVAYVTPWCPACRQSEPVVQQLRRRWQESTTVGLRVVVGQGQPEEMEGMAARIGEGSYVDAAGALWRALGVRGVPHWYVVDGKGMIVREFSGTYAGESDHVEALGLAGR